MTTTSKEYAQALFELSAGDNLIEETADVWVMVNQLSSILGAMAVMEAEEKKLRRLAERMGMDIGEAAP